MSNWELTKASQDKTRLHYADAEVHQKVVSSPGLLGAQRCLRRFGRRLSCRGKIVSSSVREGDERQRYGEDDIAKVVLAGLLRLGAQGRKITPEVAGQ